MAITHPGTTAHNSIFYKGGKLTLELHILLQYLDKGPGSRLGLAFQIIPVKAVSTDQRKYDR